jgi:hypothetical protein
MKRVLSAWNEHFAHAGLPRIIATTPSERVHWVSWQALRSNAKPYPRMRQTPGLLNSSNLTSRTSFSSASIGISLLRTSWQLLAETRDFFRMLSMLALPGKQTLLGISKENANVWQGRRGSHRPPRPCRRGCVCGHVASAALNGTHSVGSKISGAGACCLRRAIGSAPLERHDLVGGRRRFGQRPAHQRVGVGVRRDEAHPARPARRGFRGAQHQYAPVQRRTACG